MICDVRTRHCPEFVPLKSLRKEAVRVLRVLGRGRRMGCLRRGEKVVEEMESGLKRVDHNSQKKILPLFFLVGGFREREGICMPRNHYTLGKVAIFRGGVIKEKSNSQHT